MAHLFRRPAGGARGTVLAALLLAACIAQPSVPAMAAEQAAVDRGALLRAFSDTAFSYLPEAKEARLLKWEGEVRIAGLGTPSRTMTLTVEELSRGIKRVTGLPMGYTGQEVNFLIVFSNRPEVDLTGRWADYAAPFFEDGERFHQAAAALGAADAPPCLAKLVIEERAIRAALIVVRTDSDEALANQCLAHEMLGAMGIIRTAHLPDDSLLRQPTAAFATDSPVALSDSDRALLWLIYHKDMPHAVAKADGMGIAELLLEKVPGLE